MDVKHENAKLWERFVTRTFGSRTANTRDSVDSATRSQWGLLSRIPQIPRSFVHYRPVKFGSLDEVSGSTDPFKTKIDRVVGRRCANCFALQSGMLSVG